MMCDVRFLLTERSLSLISPPVIGPSTCKKIHPVISPLLACTETNLSFFYNVLKLNKQVNSKRILISIAQGQQELICKPAQPRRQRQPKKALKGNRVFPCEVRAVILTRIEGLKFSNCQNSHDVCNVCGSHSVAETQVGFILINLYISWFTQ